MTHNWTPCETGGLVWNEPRGIAGRVLADRLGDAVGPGLFLFQGPAHPRTALSPAEVRTGP